MSEELNFPTYWAGPVFDDLEVSAVIRDCLPAAPGEAFGVNQVTYLYGDCTPRGGGCSVPMSIQSWPSQVRHRSLYSEALLGAATDTTISGVPATRFGDRLEIYRPESTVVLFSEEPDLMSRFASALKRGPARLTDLETIGLRFDEGCLHQRGYCAADRNRVSAFSVFVIGLGLSTALPALAALLLGRLWLILVPLLGWPLFFLGEYAGWWGYGLGESWQYSLAYWTALGLAAVALALGLHWLVTTMLARFRAA